MKIAIKYFVIFVIFMIHEKGLYVKKLLQVMRMELRPERRI